MENKETEMGVSKEVLITEGALRKAAEMWSMTEQATRHVGDLLQKAQVEENPDLRKQLIEEARHTLLRHIADAIKVQHLFGDYSEKEENEG